MAAPSRQTLATIAGPALLAGFAFILVAGAAGAFAAGLTAQALERAAPGSHEAGALTAAQYALFGMIGALAAGLIAAIAFLELRIVRPLRLITRWAQTGHVPLEPDLVRAGPFRMVAGAVGALAVRGPAGSGSVAGAPPVETAAPGQALAQVLADLRRAQGELVDLARASAAQLVETTSAGDEAVQRFRGLTDQIAADAVTLSELSGGLSAQLNAMAEDLGSMGATVRLMSEERRGEPSGQPLGERVKEDLIAAVETMRAVTVYLERHVGTTQARIEALVASAEREGSAISERIGAAVTRVERNADSMASTAQRTGKKLVDAAEDFRRAGQIIAVEASSMRGALSDGVSGLKSARHNLDDLLQRLANAPGGIIGGAHDLHRETVLHSDSHRPPPEATPLGDADALTQFSHASHEVLQLARAIERLEKRTTELAKKAVHELKTEQAPGFDVEADRKTDETLAALMGSIERINSIAASISQAGDAATGRKVH